MTGRPAFCLRARSEKIPDLWCFRCAAPTTRERLRRQAAPGREAPWETPAAARPSTGSPGRGEATLPDPVFAAEDREPGLRLRPRRATAHRPPPGPGIRHRSGPGWCLGDVRKPVLNGEPW